MAPAGFDFEMDLLNAEAALEKLVEELATAKAEGGESDKETTNALRDEIASAQAEVDRLREDTYGNLTPWQRVLFARHKDRPRAGDYIAGLCTEFIELRGDRRFGDDPAVIAGTARFRGQPVAVIGQQKGRDTKENVARNFGMMNPEGYRKALRVMRLADKFHMPVMIFVDTPGAFPGVGAEERGQAEAIALNIQEMAGLRVPIVMTVIGEGASGGALGVGVADRVMMLENAWYCVISPEGCAAILFRDGAHAPRAADILKLTAADLLELGVIDSIVSEPVGGAHRHREKTIASVGDAIAEQIATLKTLDEDALLEGRFQKYRQMGTWREETA